MNIVGFTIERRGPVVLVDPLIDHERLRDRLELYERANGFMGPRGGYGSIIFSGDTCKELLGRGKGVEGAPGTMHLLGCEVCGTSACWPLLASIVVDDTSVIWRIVGQPYRPEWDYSTFGPFVFPRDAYMSQVGILSDRAAAAVSFGQRERPILDELARAGIVTASLDDLRQSGLRYRAAIPILSAWLPRLQDDYQLAEQCVHALSVPWAGPEVTGPLLRMFKTLPLPTDDPSAKDPSLLRWAIGSALEILMPPTHREELIALARDRRYGRSREMLVRGLRKFKQKDVLETLIELVDDEDVGGHAVNALRLWGTPGARSALESKVDDPKAWVRREARAGLAKIIKKEAAGKDRQGR